MLPIFVPHNKMSFTKKIAVIAYTLVMPSSFHSESTSLNLITSYCPI